MNLQGNNSIDEKLARSFSVFQAARLVLGTARVDVCSGRIIRPPSVYQRTYTCFCAIAILISTYSFSSEFYKKFVKIPTLYIIVLMNTYLMYIHYLLNAVHTRFLNHEQNINLYLVMQDIDQSLHLHRTSVLYDASFQSSLLFVGSILMMFVISFGADSRSDFYSKVIYIAIGVSNLSVTMEAWFCRCIMSYFIVRLKYLNFVLKDHCDPLNVETPSRFCKFHSRFWVCDNVLKRLVRDLANYYSLSSNDTVHSLKIILRGFQVFVKLYKFQSDLGYDWIGLVSWLLFEFSILIELSFSCENFLRQVDDTRVVCVHLLSLQQEGPVHSKALAMCRALERRPVRFSAYGMFELDACLPLRLLALASTYIYQTKVSLKAEYYPLTLFALHTLAVFPTNYDKRVFNKSTHFFLKGRQHTGDSPGIARVHGWR
ncbi:hypothetical protein EVAR_2392_1 [Eumeta japonica]|uniref:Gustatory receptor n=1 Tax=Eumeta variegata TaxID=151549 RepID=A0A4C1SRF2_EUMVA|nr:hypothetical protein EVAR_2392_1 [Eumeta japonica]